jgi:hypothetical protein
VSTEVPDPAVFSWNKETNHGAIKDISLEFDEDSVAYFINIISGDGSSDHFSWAKGSRGRFY